MKKVSKVGRPKSKFIKKNTTLRLYDHQRKVLEKEFGSLQKAFDSLVDEHINNKKQSRNAVQKQKRATKQLQKAS